MRKYIFIFLICLSNYTINAQRLESNNTLGYLQNIDKTKSFSDKLNDRTTHLTRDSYYQSGVKKTKVSIHPSKKRKNASYKKVYGFILNSDTYTPISNATLKVFYDTDELYNTYKTDANGFFKFNVPINNQLYVEARHKEFNLRYKKLVYLDQKKTDFFRIYLIPIDRSNSAFSEEEGCKTINLSKIPVKLRTTKQGRYILETPEPYFKFNKSEFSGKRNNMIIEYIIDILIENPNLVIEISTNTDCRGKEEYLLDLTEERAKNIRSAFLRRKIESNRIQIKGNGSSNLLNECDTWPKCSNEKHLLNRRTEFVILNPVRP